MLKATLFGIIGALVAVAITMVIGDAVSGPLIATPPGADAPEEIAIGAALFATVFGGVVGLGLAALLGRFVANPVPVFLGICVVGLVAYGAFSFSAAEETSTGVWLNIAHIAAAGPIVGALTKELQNT